MRRAWWVTSALMFFVSSVWFLAGCEAIKAAASSPEAASDAGTTIGTAVGVATANPVIGYAVGGLVTAGLGVFAAIKAKKAAPPVA